MSETTKKHIITTAYDLFSQYGIKGVSMDDIARNAGISKRTLYSHFSDKEELLLQGFILLYGQIIARLDQITSEAHSALDTILLFHEEIMKCPRWYNPRFYEDLKRYPNTLEVVEVEKKRFSEKCRLYFEQGVKEGDFQPEVNFEIVSLLAKERITMKKPSKVFSNHSTKEVYDTILLTFLKGICTEEGRAKLERYAIKQANINQIRENYSPQNNSIF